MRMASTSPLCGTPRSIIGSVRQSTRRLKAVLLRAASRLANQSDLCSAIRPVYIPARQVLEVDCKMPAAALPHGMCLADTLLQRCVCCWVVWVSRSPVTLLH